MLACFTGTQVQSCDSCHDEATCVKSKERGDTFVGLSCVCKEGFVGDGLLCYDEKLCSDSSCCSQGYHWLAENGCVDTDECSLGGSPCPPPQVCQNTPGSFECLEPSSRTRSNNSDRSVQFDCGHVICPEGMDCLPGNDGIMNCVDPCQIYKIISDDWRATNYTSGVPHTDYKKWFEGWYRFFLWGESAHIPERCVAERRCGTTVPIWMKNPHPTEPGVIAGCRMCGHRYGQCCDMLFYPMYVKLCKGNFYTYKLSSPWFFESAYCAGNSAFDM